MGNKDKGQEGWAEFSVWRMCPRAVLLPPYHSSAGAGLVPRDVLELGLPQLEFPCLSKEKKGLLGRESQLEENLPLIPNPPPRFWVFFHPQNREENASLEV